MQPCMYILKVPNYYNPCLIFALGLPGYLPAKYSLDPYTRHVVYKSIYIDRYINIDIR